MLCEKRPDLLSPPHQFTVYAALLEAGLGEEVGGETVVMEEESVVGTAESSQVCWIRKVCWQELLMENWV